MLRPNMYMPVYRYIVRRLFLFADTGVDEYLHTFLILEATSCKASLFIVYSSWHNACMFSGVSNTL